MFPIIIWGLLWHEFRRCKVSAIVHDMAVCVDGVSR